MYDPDPPEMVAVSVAVCPATMVGMVTAGFGALLMPSVRMKLKKARWAAMLSTAVPASQWPPSYITNPFEGSP